MEPNDEMIVDEENALLVQDIEDIGKNKLMPNKDMVNKQIDVIELDEESDEDINIPINSKVLKHDNDEDNDNNNDEDINENIAQNNNNSIIPNTNNDNQMIIDGEDPKPQVISHKKERNNLIRFPLAKIKNTIKLDDDIKLCQKNVYYVIGKMTELFLQELAAYSHQICKMSKRKTLNIDDINTAIKAKDKYSFIDMPSIFHIDIIGSNSEKGRKGKANSINQATLMIPESNEPITTTAPSKTNTDMKKSKNEASPKSKKEKGKKKTKTAQKKIESMSNMKIDQMFSK